MAAHGELVKSIFLAFSTGAIRFTVNGGLFYQRAPERVLTSTGVDSHIGDTVYGILNVESDGKEFTSGYSIEDYLVSIQIYSGSSISDASEIQTALDSLMGGITVPSPNRVMRVRPMEDTLRLDELEVKLKDLLVVEATWKVKLQVTR